MGSGEDGPYLRSITRLCNGSVAIKISIFIAGKFAAI
jgi:hypothetical protein